MTTIVDTSDEDPLLAAVLVIAGLACDDDEPEVAEQQVARVCMEAEEYIVLGRWLDLVSLMLSSAEFLFSRAPKEVEWLEVAYDEIENENYDLEAIAMIVFDASISIIMFGYCYLCGVIRQFNATIKYGDSAFARLVKVDCISGFNAIEVVGIFTIICNLVAKATNLEESMEMVRLISAKLAATAKRFLLFLDKVFGYICGEDAYTMSEAKEVAVRAIVEFVKSPDRFQCDLLDMAAVEQLEKDEKYALMYQLLKIFLTQRLDAYLDFYAANSTLLKSYGLVHEDCITKMRLKSLADLGSSGSGVIPKNQTTAEQIEVVIAVSERVDKNGLEPSLDTEHVLGLPWWEALRLKLGSWRDNVASVFNTVQSNTTAEESAQALEGLIIQ
ncbi:hypothetical protein QJS04_geneDACA007976 [Acorus gramineus]|uniref:Uncharacterized protein n=1 Tax=Acorus gramineus TaxID=55184 RepID=A0AAV9BCN6_ACOGR|nr:hypothetical protein QJS04_geneDACA007976 [Acorus gramineus]